MSTKKAPSKPRDEPRPRDRAEKRKREAELEQALEDTFPSSDPISLTQPTVASKKKPRR